LEKKMNLLLRCRKDFGVTSRPSRRTEYIGTAPLKEIGLLFSDAKSKASILSHQYQSVFSKEGTSEIPVPEEPPFPPMPEIIISREGVLKQLMTLKEQKTSGPDTLPPRVLKAAAQPISYCLDLIFKASLATGVVPLDWRQANITPVFKKGELNLKPQIIDLFH
jgi:hypothetical protein